MNPTKEPACSKERWELAGAFDCRTGEAEGVVAVAVGSAAVSAAVSAAAAGEGGEAAAAGEAGIYS